ncbi:MAG TPA: IS481 family transposase [Thermopetrobacter sp.]|nr:IS481 family transposase [Thermopetrobacter sp.]
MGWQEVSIMDQRREFVMFASRDDANISELCRRFGISRTTGYKWLHRAGAGEESFADRSRRPLHSPARTSPEIEERIVMVRTMHPAWGARKIRSWLSRRGMEVPAASTVHAILRRHGLIQPHAPGAPLGRFEQDAPNLQWQMDFKGRTRLNDGSYVHPLSVLDDHSRFCLLLEACARENHDTVRPLLERVLRRYGLPASIYVDNGTPWGSATPGQWTRLGVWLLKLGIRVVHGRPYHPQGRGKIERFHRSLKAETLNTPRPADMNEAAARLRRWRHIYNQQRPHEALDMRTPADVYTPSPRSFPDKLPEVEYDEGEIVRRVPRTKGYIHFKGKLRRVPDAFRGELLAIRPTATDGVFDVCFGSCKIAEINVKEGQTSNQKSVNHVPEHLSAMSPG